MEKIVYKFLDKYIGKEFQISVNDEIDALDHFCLVKVIKLSSMINQVDIMRLVYKQNQIKPFIVYGANLGECISNFFSVDIGSAHRLVQTWFRGNYNLKSIEDIDRFVKYKWETQRKYFL